MSDLQYPIGRFSLPVSTTADERQAWIREIARTPKELRAAVEGLSPEQLDTPYRPGGWTARQVAHHVPDSHMNAFIRFRLALTEDSPTIKPYDQSAWAKLADAAEDPAVSIQILEGLHRRWHRLLEAMSEADFARRAVHPDHGPVTNDWFLQLYAWHGRHHIGHIKLTAQ